MAQEQQPPPQQPPPAEGAGPAARPPTETAEKSLTVSVWPSGQVAGAEASAIGRVCSKVAPHARQRYSYRAMSLSLWAETASRDGVSRAG